MIFRSLRLSVKVKQEKFNHRNTLGILRIKFLYDIYVSEKDNFVQTFIMIAGVVKLVDALDSKSSGPCVRVGSIPTSGTIL